jgi:proteasome accessory factor B
MHTGDRYRIPKDFDANKFLHTAWGIIPSRKLAKVKLRFDANVAQIARETVWHSSQKNEEQPDGSLNVSFELALSPDFKGFVLSWGEKVQVLQPADLRKNIIDSAIAIQKMYSG